MNREAHQVESATQDPGGNYCLLGIDSERLRRLWRFRKSIRLLRLPALEMFALEFSLRCLPEQGPHAGPLAPRRGSGLGRAQLVLRQLGSAAALGKFLACCKAWVIKMRALAFEATKDPKCFRD